MASISQYYKENIKPYLAHPLNRRNKLSAIKNFLYWQFMLRMLSKQNAEILVPLVGKVRMLVKKGETGITGNLYSGLHEFETMIFLLHYVRPPDVFADVGANVGSYTLLASGYGGCTSHTFEPAPSTFQRLKNNIALNGLDHLVKLYNSAAGDRLDTISFTTDLDTMNHIVASGYSGNTVEVPLQPLDDVIYAKGYRPTILKIDAEGYDLEVLNGASSILEDPCLKVVFLESRGEMVLNMMAPKGFVRVAYDAFSRTIAETPEGDIFIRDLPEIRQRILSSPKVSIRGHQL